MINQHIVQKCELSIFPTRIIFFLLFLPILLPAQVINDDIHQAKILNVGEPLSSNTAYATIQPECVNYALTKSCLKYHNDQWFIFNSGSYGHVYINIAKQKCRDLLGVQLVALEGEPCKTQEYALLECVSFSSNDDFYVKLDSLKPATDYLLNIDGYLHDFCSFDITVDTIPLGMPNEVNLNLESKARQDSSLVQLSWWLADSVVNKFQYFEIWKRHEKEYKHELKEKIVIRRNAYGSVEKQYSFLDTIAEDAMFYYRLLAVDKNGRKLLFDEYQFQGVAPIMLSIIQIRLMYPMDTPISLTISDKDTGEVFRKVRFSFDPLKHDLLEYPVSYLADKGVSTVVVEVVNDKTGGGFRKEYRLR